MASYVTLSALLLLMVTAHVIRGMPGKPGPGKPGPGGKKPGPWGGKPGGDYTVPSYAVPYLAGRGGRNGRDGEKGMKGVKGAKGEKGFPGAKSEDNGDTGPKGYKGDEGEKGWDGDGGDMGFKGIKGMKGAPGEINPGGGSIYINWGSNTCASPAEVVYTGYAVSPAFNDAGGGAQYLCLDLDNIDSGDLTVDTTVTLQSQSRLVGVHFETAVQNPPSSEFPNGSPSHEEPLHDFDGFVVVCAVCLTSNTDVLMVPNSQSCPDSDTMELEYTGYLMAARDYIHLPTLNLNHGPVFSKPIGATSTHFRTEYICVNSNPVMEGSNMNPTSEGMLAHTRIFCRDLVGFLTPGCTTVDSSTCLNHCALGPLGCAVCSHAADLLP